LDVLDAKVARLLIGVHAVDLQDRIRISLEGRGWIKGWDFSPGGTTETPFGPVNFVDGVQSWTNPRLLEAFRIREQPEIRQSQPIASGSSNRVSLQNTVVGADHAVEERVGFDARHRDVSSDMRLFVSVCAWGERKSSNQDANGGVYLVNLSRQCVEAKHDLPVLSGASRAAGGLALQDDELFVSYMMGDDRDEIIVLDRATLCFRRRLLVPDVYDVHQLDMFDGLLWFLNSNRAELVAVNPAGGHVCGRKALRDDLPEERAMEPVVNADTMTDSRRRIHPNSVMVRDGEAQIGHFGIERGDFRSSQLAVLPWSRDGDAVVFGERMDLPVSGKLWPHNMHVRASGEQWCCDSGQGVMHLSDKCIDVGGFPRGIAADSRHVYIGVSSVSPSDTLNDVAIVTVVRATGREVGRFHFPRENGMGGPGQIYELRLATGVDHATSEGARLLNTETHTRDGKRSRRRRRNRMKQWNGVRINGGRSEGGLS
jgi:hypothetical protein